MCSKQFDEFLSVDFILCQHYLSKSNYPQLLQQFLLFFLTPAHCHPGSCPPVAASFGPCDSSFFAVASTGFSLTMSSLSFLLQLQKVCNAPFHIDFSLNETSCLKLEFCTTERLDFPKHLLQQPMQYPSHTVYTAFLSS